MRNKVGLNFVSKNADYPVHVLNRMFLCDIDRHPSENTPLFVCEVIQLLSVFKINIWLSFQFSI